MGTDYRPHYCMCINRLKKMEWLDSVVGAVGGGLLSVLGSVAYFRPKLREAKADASKAEAEANAATFEHLMERINKMDKLYEEQSKVIDDLRSQILTLGQEKLERDKEIQQLRSENEENKMRIESLTRELDAYKILVKK